MTIPIVSNEPDKSPRWPCNAARRRVGFMGHAIGNRLLSSFSWVCGAALGSGPPKKLHRSIHNEPSKSPRWLGADTGCLVRLYGPNNWKQVILTVFHGISPRFVVLPGDPGQLSKKLHRSIRNEPDGAVGHLVGFYGP